MDRKALSLTETAEALGLHRHTVRALVEEGRIRAVRVGRRYLVPLKELDRLLEEPSKTA